MRMLLEGKKSALAAVGSLRVLLFFFDESVSLLNNTKMTDRIERMKGNTSYSDKADSIPLRRRENYYWITTLTRVQRGWNRQPRRLRSIIKHLSTYRNQSTEAYARCTWWEWLFSLKMTLNVKRWSRMTTQVEKVAPMALPVLVWRSRISLRVRP